MAGVDRMRPNALFKKGLSTWDLAALCPGVRVGADWPGSAGGGGGGNIGPAMPARRAIPVINSVTAGYPHDFTDLDYPPSVADEYVQCPEVDDPQAFSARVIGDSMEPNYVEGDLITFFPSLPPRSGDDCFVRFASDGATTFKRFTLRPDGKIRLQPLNPRYPVEVYDPEEITGLWPAVMRIQRLR